MSVVVAALVVFGVKTYYEKKTTNNTEVLVEKENNASNEVGTKEVSDEMLVPGYALGEIPAITIPEIPDLSIKENPNAKITLDMTKKISAVPGISVTPVRVENGNIVGGDYTMQIGQNGNGQFTDKNKTVQTDGNGAGQYADENVTIQRNEDGSGQYTNKVTGVTLQVEPNGSGQFIDTINKFKYQIDADGTGQYIDEKNNIKIAIDQKGSIYTNNNITIKNNVDGSGTYSDTDKDLLITLDSGILFDVDKYDVRPEAEVALKNLAVVLKETDVKAFQIDGHTDSDASDEHNQVLSENRANAVKSFLAAQGLTAEISINGYGESRPIASNDTAEGKQKNRRVEIIIPTI